MENGLTQPSCSGHVNSSPSVSKPSSRQVTGIAVGFFKASDWVSFLPIQQSSPYNTVLNLQYTVKIFQNFSGKYWRYNLSNYTRNGHCRGLSGLSAGPQRSLRKVWDRLETSPTTVESKSTTVKYKFESNSSKPKQVQVQVQQTPIFYFSHKSAIKTKSENNKFYFLVYNVGM